MVARVGKLSRFATHRLELDRGRVAHGYFLRFSKRATRALAAGRDRRVPVSLRVAQTLDLDSDGDREDRALATTTRNVPLARPATTIEPEDGTYVSAQNGDSLQVSGGAVTYYDFSIDPQCASGRAADKVQAPINPTNGVFSINDTARGTIDVSVAVSGQFTDNTQLNINGALTTGTEGPIPEPCATPLDAQFALSTT